MCHTAKPEARAFEAGDTKETTFSLRNSKGNPEVGQSIEKLPPCSQKSMTKRQLRLILINFTCLKSLTFKK